MRRGGQTDWASKGTNKGVCEYAQSFSRQTLKSGNYKAAPSRPYTRTMWDNEGLRSRGVCATRTARAGPLMTARTTRPPGQTTTGTERSLNTTTHKLIPTASPRSVAISLHASHLSRPIFLPTNSFLSMGEAGAVVLSKNGRYSTSKDAGRLEHCAMAS